MNNKAMRDFQTALALIFTDIEQSQDQIISERDIIKKAEATVLGRTDILVMTPFKAAETRVRKDNPILIIFDEVGCIPDGHIWLARTEQDGTMLLIGDPNQASIICSATDGFHTTYKYTLIDQLMS